MHRCTLHIPRRLMVEGLLSEAKWVPRVSISHLGPLYFSLGLVSRISAIPKNQVVWRDLLQCIAWTMPEPSGQDFSGSDHGRRHRSISSSTSFDLVGVHAGGWFSTKSAISSLRFPGFVAKFIPVSKSITPSRISLSISPSKGVMPSVVPSRMASNSLLP